MSTIYDVAKAASVSPKTVSRVLNGDGPVGRETRAAVERAMADLRYVPPPPPGRCGPIAPASSGSSPAPSASSPEQPALSGLPELFVVQGVQKALEAAGMTLMISDTGGKAERIPDLLRTFVRHRAEGIVFVADHHKEVTLPPLVGSANLVLANCYDRAGTPAVVPDDREGQRRLVRRMIAAGHRRIAYLTLPRALDATALRTKGYADALAEAGLPFDPDLVVEADVAPPEPEAEVQLLGAAIGRVLGLPDPPTALCLGNDRMAVRAYGMLRSQGLEIPQDISVAGFDDYRAIAESLFPRLTTAELPYGRMGRRAARILLDLIDGQPAPEEAREAVAGDVVWRESVRMLT
jgi:LacI family transcriptional regulator